MVSIPVDPIQQRRILRVKESFRRNGRKQSSMVKKKLYHSLGSMLQGAVKTDSCVMDRDKFESGVRLP